MFQQYKKIIPCKALSIIYIQYIFWCWKSPISCMLKCVENGSEAQKGNLVFFKEVTRYSRRKMSFELWHLEFSSCSAARQLGTWENNWGASGPPSVSCKKWKCQIISSVSSILTMRLCYFTDLDIHRHLKGPLALPLYLLSKSQKISLHKLFPNPPSLTIFVPFSYSVM